jgi:hypothetical protein
MAIDETLERASSVKSHNMGMDMEMEENKTNLLAIQSTQSMVAMLESSTYPIKTKNWNSLTQTIWYNTQAHP